MKKPAVLGALVGLFLGASLWAEDGAAKKVNFSGSWVLDTGKSKVERSTPQGGGPVSMGRGGGYPGGGYPPGGNPPGGGNPGGGNPGGGRRGGGPPAGPEIMRYGTLVIDQSDGELKITRQPDAGDVGRQELVQVFLLDGSESVNPVSPEGGELRSRTSWDKDKLVTLGTQGMPDSGIAEKTVIKQEITISKDGRTLTVKTTATGAGGGYTAKEVYARRSEPK